MCVIYTFFMYYRTTQVKIAYVHCVVSVYVVWFSLSILLARQENTYLLATSIMHVPRELKKTQKNKEVRERKPASGHKLF